MHKRLFIQTASVQPFIAFIEDETVLAMIDNDTLSRSEELLRTIDTGLQDLMWKPEEIQEILFVNGPGSFTGLRIGLAIIQTWQSVHQPLVRTINHEDYLRTLFPDFNEFTLICIAAGMGSCFVSSKNHPDPAKKTYEEIQQLIQEQNITTIVGDIPEYYRPAFLKYTQSVPTSFVSATLFSDHVMECLQDMKEVHSIEARYIAQPHITKSKSS